MSGKQTINKLQYQGTGEIRTNQLMYFRSAHHYLQSMSDESDDINFGLLY